MSGTDIFSVAFSDCQVSVCLGHFVSQRSGKSSRAWLHEDHSDFAEATGFQADLLLLL